jgi:hypothetical protein
MTPHPARENHFFLFLFNVAIICTKQSMALEPGKMEHTHGGNLLWRSGFDGNHLTGVL